MSVYSKLATIQSKLSAPKGQYNSFGQYNYRNCEDILEAVKPLLKETDTVVLLSDEVVFKEGALHTFYDVSLVKETLKEAPSGKENWKEAVKRKEEQKTPMVTERVSQGRFYVEATATLVDCETGEKVSVKASAREAEDKKGMDSSQVTGSTSSYARKYALNGLLAIDDNKDADFPLPVQEPEEKPKTATKRTTKPFDIANWTKAVEALGWNVDTALETFGADKATLTKEKATEIYNAIKG